MRGSGPRRSALHILVTRPDFSRLRYVGPDLQAVRVAADVLLGLLIETVEVEVEVEAERRLAPTQRRGQH
jgi:hypothetical protein